MQVRSDWRRSILSKFGVCVAQAPRKLSGKT